MHSRALSVVAALFASFAPLPPPPLVAPDPGAPAREDPAAQFEKKRQALRLEQSQRRLEYGLELRKQGLTTQSAEQIILAAELGEGRHPGATQVLWIMRQYDEAFWKRHGSRPTAGKLESYVKKARALAEKEQKEVLELADWASAHQCGLQATAIYVDLLLRRDEPLEFDAKGRIVLSSGTIPAAPSAKLRENAVAINGRLYVRDELLAQLPDLAAVFEVSDEEVRVRTTTSLEDARDLHALCKALLPRLAADIGAKPERRLPLLVLAKRADYERTLDALGLGSHKTVTGVASYRPFVAIVCADDAPLPSSTEEVPEDAGRGPARDVLRGVCLHELTHLYSGAVSRSVFPAWYEEGFADTYGGTETFAWDGKELEVGGLLGRSRIDALKAEGGRMPLSELLVTDALATWQEDREAGLAFYAQAWAFVRYLRTGAGSEVAARFEQWEERCRGQALGFELGVARTTQRAPASDLFRELFGEDLPKLEAGFADWLRDL